MWSEAALDAVIAKLALERDRAAASGLYGLADVLNSVLIARCEDRERERAVRRAMKAFDIEAPFAASFGVTIGPI